MLVIIRGAGDIATGIALRLRRAHIQVIMTDIPAPTAIRRTVAFSRPSCWGRRRWRMSPPAGRTQPNRPWLS